MSGTIAERSEQQQSESLRTKIYAGVFARFRRQRMQRFFELMRPTAATTVLDIGGAPKTWESESSEAAEFSVTLYNVHFLEGFADRGRFHAVQGDATALPFADGSFEVAFSNSTIEHMGTWERQQEFAREARRVGRKLWIQTPARSFPMEPHMMAPLVHFLPRGVQRMLVRWFTPWGWMYKPTAKQVEDLLDEIRLLSYGEVRELFPDCRILKERLLGMTKSYVAVRV